MNERDLFIASLRHDDSADRVAFVDNACGNDADLRRRILSLLAAHDEAGDFLCSPSSFVRDSTVPSPAFEGPGCTIGSYKILRQLGEGGFGVVFLAEQTSPFQRIVALKVIKPGMDTRQVKARFEAERHALALMDHPHIARVLDVGTAESSRSFIAMEFVNGISITKYCDERRLSLRKRLELLVPVCQAVQHAHQKGIIHRDLKPSNVIIGLYDDQPVAKIIDFGVAKALGTKLTEQTLNTELGSVIGTLQYMSPEQAELNALDIDAHSDIYSLGVLLYELLTGSTPIDKSQITEIPFFELLRIIREDEPPRPSDRLSKSDQLASIAVCRGLESKKLIGLVRGELDWIVMKCLEKDRGRRYATANDLALDLSHFLRDEPVLACPPSILYRCGKFVKRYRWPVFSAGLVAIAMLVGVIGTGWQAVRATRERNEKEMARRESAKNERIALAAAADARQKQTLADRERARAERNFSLARDAVDRMFTRVARDLRDVPHTEQVRRSLLEDALGFYADRRQQQTTDPQLRLETARAHLRVGNICEMLGRARQAEHSFRAACALLEGLAAESPGQAEYSIELAKGYTGIGFRLMFDNRTDDTIQYFRKALAIRDKLAVDFPDDLRHRIELALCHTEFGNALKAIQPEEAEQQLRQAISVLDRVRADAPGQVLDRGTVAHCRQWLGIFLLQIYGQHEEAELHIRQALQLREQLAAESPNDSDLKGSVSQVQGYLAELLLRTARAAQAELLFRDAIAVREQLINQFPTVAEHRRQNARLWEGMSGALWGLNRPLEAEHALARTIEIRERLVAEFEGTHPDPDELASAHYQMGKIYRVAGRVEDADKSFSRALELARNLALEPPEITPGKQLLVEILAGCPSEKFRDPERAVQLAKDMGRSGQTSGGYWRWTPVAGGQCYILAMALNRAGRWKEAVDALEQAIRLCPGEDGGRFLHLAIANWNLGRHAAARQWYERTMSWMRRNERSDVELQLLSREVTDLLNSQPTAGDSLGLQRLSDWPAYGLGLSEAFSEAMESISA